MVLGSAGLWYYIPTKMVKEVNGKRGGGQNPSLSLFFLLILPLNFIRPAHIEGAFSFLSPLW